MTEYTIIQPHFEFIPPAKKGKELEFLEICTRTCYKSEDKIKPGSAKKLMSKVINEYKHYSVTEHQRWVVKLHTNPTAKEWTSNKIHELNNLMVISKAQDAIIISGNLRMWTDLFKQEKIESVFVALAQKFCTRFPIFSMELAAIGVFGINNLVEELDENPLTNQSNMTVKELKLHTSLTIKAIGDRSMSHQLVRHRLFAFSQESQRYCNYGKKGFQFIVPPAKKEMQDAFICSALEAYESYLSALDIGFKPEDARGVLPNCTKTEVVTTGTLGYWKYVFKHRADNPKAQWQIRGIMQATQTHFKELLPAIF